MGKPLRILAAALALFALCSCPGLLFSGEGSGTISNGGTSDGAKAQEEPAQGDQGATPEIGSADTAEGFQG